MKTLTDSLVYEKNKNGKEAVEKSDLDNKAKNSHKPMITGLLMNKRKAAHSHLSQMFLLEKINKQSKLSL